MDIFRFFNKKNVLLRCTKCLYEYEISPREVRLLLNKNATDPICPIKEECHLCHIGFMIPVKHTDNRGNQYLYHEIKPKIKNLDPDTVMERIFGDDHDGFVMYIPPDTEL